MKNTNKGITLIALIITIIVLLILAGVAIATLTGENGILTQAKNAKKEMTKAEAKERIQLEVLGSYGTDGEINIATLKANIAKNIPGAVIGEETELPLTVKVGDYTFTVKANGVVEEGTPATGGPQGKTIAELYDGYNNPKDTQNYNENAMHIGDYVSYTAGEWTETKAAPTSGYTFGGYTAGQSRDASASGSGTDASGDVTYEGWRIWDISEDKQTVTLISAGCPELYYHPDTYSTSQFNGGYISDYILTGTINSDADANSLGLGTTYEARDWSMYENEELYAQKDSARSIQKSYLDTWYKKYIDSSITDLYNVASFPSNAENKLISTVENRFTYWLSGVSRGPYFAWISSDSRKADHGLSNEGFYAHGVRVLVSLTPEVKFKETPEKVEKDGFTYNKWIIE